jgi:hypothetical protein
MDHWLVRPATLRRLWIIFAVVLAVVVLVELTIHREPHFALEALFGFGAWFGFLSCVALIVFAKVLGALLKRPDDYYDD